MIKTFDEQGYSEPGNIELQLKATEMCRFSKDGTYISFRIEVKHYNAWKDFPMPIFLVLFEVSTATAYWLYLQDYFAKKQPRKNAKYMQLRMPVENVLTPKAVDYMQDRKAVMVEQMQKGTKHEG